MRRTYWMSVEQICTIVAALMLASCVRVHAQFGVEQPFFFRQGEVISGGYTGTVQSLPGLFQYWLRTNGITTDAPAHTPARITNWAALIGNNAFRKANATYTKWPSNSADNVFFNGFYEGNYLDSDAISMTNYSLGLIIKPRRLTSTADPVIFPNSAIGSGISLTSTTNILCDVRNASGGQMLVNVGYIGAVLSDLVLVYSNSLTEGGLTAYVNGLLTTNKTSSVLTNIQNSWNRLGYDTANYYDGWYYELAFFTNLFTSINASNFHHYRTNVYGP